MTDLRIETADRPPEVLAVAVGENGPLLDGISTRVLPVAARTTIDAFLADSDATAKPGEVRDLPLPGSLPRRVLLVAIGEGSFAQWRLAGASLARVAKGPFGVAVPRLAGAQLAALSEGLLLGAYRYAVKPPPTVRITLHGADDQAAVDRGIAYARGGLWARDLTNTRTSTKTPHWVGAQAERELAPLGVQVLTRDAGWLAEQGFGGVLAVGAGSASPPCLVEAVWRPRGTAGAPHLVLVGKGITFDTGGYNLKPGDSMKAMHTDMAGGAAVLGALRVLAALRVPVRVTALVPLAENAVSGSAMRPGDVVRHYGGRTTEIVNTDAEGRLVLADALAYAAARLRPAALVDIATLTGGVKVALGTQTAGLFATSDDLASDLGAAADATGEPLWRLPMRTEYEAQLRSDIADANNSAGNPQAMTAAMYLRPFAGDRPWAHLDIAGPARAGADGGLFGRGATGFGARLLASWAESQARR